jgi:hypothetical protein
MGVALPKEKRSLLTEFHRLDIVRTAEQRNQICQDIQELTRINLHIFSNQFQLSFEYLRNHLADDYYLMNFD